MKVTDYIAEFLQQKNITDVFGYPGGMVTELMESFSKYNAGISAHVNYHEQGAAFCACGYAQASGKTGFAYATSGPGATNLITGICNAYFDSIPVIFLTGQVNTFESKKDSMMRQKGFQETDIISMVRNVTKYSAYIENADDIGYHLEKACYTANEGRKGPVLLDVPMNIQKTEIHIEHLRKYSYPSIKNELKQTDVEIIRKELKLARRPCILIGAGAHNEEVMDLFQKFILLIRIPVITSMIAIDVLPDAESYNYGFIGAYGDRAANFIAAKCDLIISMGARLDSRQVGAVKEQFAPNAKLIRIDIDQGELQNKVKDDEMQICCNLKDILVKLLQDELKVPDYSEWIKICDYLKKTLSAFDDEKPNLIIKKISQSIKSDTIITTDVGQNQIWVAQSFIRKAKQKFLFSGGHGAMGYSLPAAIGAYYGSKKPVISFCGDGGFQMNMQELQFIAREQIPITIVILNNFALGMIRHFQELYFSANYTQTVYDGGYTTPDFEKIALAYQFQYFKIKNTDEVNDVMFECLVPTVVEVILDEETYVFPKLEFGKPIQDQEPLISREVYDALMEL